MASPVGITGIYALHVITVTERSAGGGKWKRSLNTRTE